MRSARKQSQGHFGYDLPLTPQMIEHYSSIGPREGDIALAFTLAGNPHNANVIELGCGLGRDAASIVERTPYYLGLDTSPDVITYAQEHVPAAHFDCADFLTYKYQPNTYDIVFSFAALRYCTMEVTEQLFRRLEPAVRPGGIIYLSLMHADKYQWQHRPNDLFGPRNMAVYSPDDIIRLAGSAYAPLHQRIDTVMGERWFEIALQRKA